MFDDVLLNKIQTIERCIKRINEVYDSNPDNLIDFTKQDSIVLNLQRASEACIDIAMHICSEERLGIPQNSRDSFELLVENGIIDFKLLRKLKAMVGFRNIAVHDYQSINIDIVKDIIENHLDDFVEFKNKILTYLESKK